MNNLNKEDSIEDLHLYEGINYYSEDDEYEPSHDTDKYKEWELKERFLNEMVELNKELGDVSKNWNSGFKRFYLKTIQK